MPSSTTRLAVCLGMLVAASAVPALPAAAAPQPLGESVRVSLSAPIEVRRGRAADLGVAVSAPATGERVPGVTVILYGRPPRGGGWAEADREVTNSRGVAAFRTAPTRTTDFAAESLPLGSYDGGTSGIVRVKVRR
jgi:hypothetical protein